MGFDSAFRGLRFLRTLKKISLIKTSIIYKATSQYLHVALTAHVLYRLQEYGVKFVIFWVPFRKFFAGKVKMEKKVLNCNR